MTNSFDYNKLKQKIEHLAHIASEQPEDLADAVDIFLDEHEKLPPECADIIFWVLTRNLDFSGVVRCFDWYTLSDVYQKLAVDHGDMPVVILDYLQKHPSVDCEELAPFLWFACLYRLAAQNAWQISLAGRLELFRAFVENMTVYALHIVQSDVWNDNDIYLLQPELRLAYHVNRAYACLEQDDLNGYSRYLDHAAEDCPDLNSCIEALKNLPYQQETPLQQMSHAEVQKYAMDRTTAIKRAFADEDWIQTAELVKRFDREGFDTGSDFELLNIQCQLAERGLLW